MESYVPAAHAEAELVEKRSRFIGQVWRVESEEAAREHLEAVRRAHRDARHNCWCLRLASLSRCSDDGEPQGTAGVPMLTILERQNVVQALVVVTRYFGGILLGAGGLLRAYSQCAREALEQAGLEPLRQWRTARLACPYALYERLTQELPAYGAQVDESVFGSDVVLTLRLPPEQSGALSERFRNLTKGARAVEFLDMEGD